MNTRVDLIYKSEQRSARIINMRMLSRVATVAVPSIIAVAIAVSIANVMMLKGKVKMAEAVWNDFAPKKAEALVLRDRLVRNEDVVNELEGWKNSKMLWGEFLLSIQDEIRPKLQLDRINIIQGLQLIDNKFPARVFRGTINGMGIGSTARIDVKHLQSTLISSPVFTQAVDTVSITFGAAPDQRQNRVFKLDINFKPMVFKNEDTRN